MKKTALFLSAILLLYTLLSCARTIPKGHLTTEEHIDTCFKDHVEYCKYVYPDDKAVQDEGVFSLVEDRDVSLIKTFVSVARERWAAGENEVQTFDFDDSRVKTGDLWTLDAHDGYRSFELLYFERETLTLYRFASKI